MNTTVPGQSHACHDPHGNDLRHTEPPGEQITGERESDLSTSEPCGEQITAARVTDLTTPNGPAMGRVTPADRVLVTAPCFVPDVPPSWVTDDNVDADGFAPEVHGFWEHTLGAADGVNITVTQYVRETAEHPGLLCISPAYVAGHTLALNTERDAGDEGDLDLQDVGTLAALLVMAHALMLRADDETRAWARANGGTVLC